MARASARSTAGKSKAKSPPPSAKAPPAKKGGKAAQAEPEDDSEVEYTVERIANKYIHKGKTMYLIKWKDFGDEENTWEPPENLHPALVKEFEAGLKAGVKLEPVGEEFLEMLLGDERTADAEEPEEPEEEEAPDDSGSEYSAGEAGASDKRKRTAPAKTGSAAKKSKDANGKAAATATKKKKPSKREPSSDEESEEGSEEEESNGGSRGSAKENSQPAPAGNQFVARNRGINHPMVFPENTYLVREADFAMKKGERPYLKDGVPIWRVDNRHLIQLYKRTRPDCFTTFTRTDLYDAWMSTDSTGLHAIEVVSAQRVHGRDTEVTLNLDQKWVDKMKKYDRDEGLTFESSAPTSSTDRTSKKKDTPAAEQNGKDKDGENEAEAEEEDEEEEEEEERENE